MIRNFKAYICPLILMGTICAQDDQYFINDLKISDEDKRMLLSLTPSSYIGIANKLVDQI